VTLQDSTIPIQGFNRHEYNAASQENCPVVPIQQTYSQETLKKLRLLAQDIPWLITSTARRKLMNHSDEIINKYDESCFEL